MMHPSLSLDLYTIRILLAVAETQSFTRAAERIGRSQSAVTQQVQRLEDLLGQPLFVRSSRRVTPTATGEVLLSYGRKMLLLEEQCLAEIREGDTTGEVRFGSPEDFATHYLPGILQRFTATHPRITLMVNCELTLTLIEAFQRGDYDLVIIKQEPGSVTLGARPLWREPLVWTGTPGMLDMYRSSDDTLPLVLSPAPCVYRQRTLEALASAHRPWRIAYTSPSLAGTIAAVRAGLGVTVLPQNIVPQGLRSVVKSANLPSLKDTIICVLHHPNPSPAVQAFADYVAHVLPQEGQGTQE